MSPKLARLAVLISLLVGLLAPAHALASGAAPTADSQAVDVQTNAVGVTITLTGDDPESDPLTFSVDTVPAHGSLDTTSPTVACHGASGCSADVVYTPDTDYNGPDSLTFTVNDGSSASPTATVTITVNAAPSFTVGANQSDAEDSGAHTISNWITDASAGPGEGSQVLTFVVTNNTNTGLFSAGPAVSASGTLTYTTATDAFGTATITLRLDDDHGGSTGTQTFDIVLTPVNDPPTFTKGANQSAAESSSAHTVTGWATNILPGGTGETGQVLTFVVTGDTNTGLFSILPAVSATGTLTYTLAANQNGTATISLRLDDDGGQSSGIQSFTIAVSAVNNAPTFTMGPDKTVLEDAGAQSFSLWATSISPGTNEDSQTVSFVVTATTKTLFSVQPAVSPAGTGRASLLVAVGALARRRLAGRELAIRLVDSLGATTTTQYFVITITPVNDAPTFTRGSSPTVNEDSGARTITGWATAILPGGTGETGQVLTFVVTGNSNPGLFAVAPAVSAAGTLTFTPATNRNGSASITLVLKDNGGTLNGGADTSAPVAFSIKVNPVNDPPNAVNDVGLTVNQNAGATALAVLTNDSILPDAGETLTISAVTQAAHGTVARTGSGTGLTYTPAPAYRGTDSFTYTISDGSLTDTATVLLDVVQAGSVTRLGHGDRYGVSASISAATFAPGVAVVYIASGLSFAEALAGAPVAGIKHAPILLVTTDTIPATVATDPLFDPEMTRLRS